MCEPSLAASAKMWSGRLCYVPRVGQNSAYRVGQNNAYRVGQNSA
jgi:hypothetical protein